MEGGEEDVSRAAAVSAARPFRASAILLKGALLGARAEQPRASDRAASLSQLSQAPSREGAAVVRRRLRGKSSADGVGVPAPGTDGGG